MASPLIEAEEHVEEDFFDKLVADEEDDKDLSGSGPSSVDRKESDRVKKEFSNLCTDKEEEDDAAVVDDEDKVGLELSCKKAHEDDLNAEANNSSLADNVTRQIEGVMEMQAEFDSDVDKIDVSSGTGVKVVDWSAFKTDSALPPDEGKGSYSDFFNELELTDNSVVGANSTESVCGNEVSSNQHHEGQLYEYDLAQTSDLQDMNSSQYWENMYPGWRYDANTGQWYQIEGYNSQQCFDANAYSQGNFEYPSYMVFDPQYPGWYYDTVAQEWKLLESYTSSITQYNQYFQNGVPSTCEYLNKNTHRVYDNYDQIAYFGSQGLNDKNHQSTKSVNANSIDNQRLHQSYDSTHQGYYSADHKTQEPWYNSADATSFDQASHGFDMSNGFSGSQSISQAEGFSHLNQHNRKNSQQLNFSSGYFDNLTFSQQGATQLSSASDEERSSAGRPTHALVTFGFGGKLVVMMNNSSFLTNSAYGSQDSVGGVINIVNLMELVMEKADHALTKELGAFSYFYTLCHQSFPGPLVGVNVGSRDLNKWIDEKITKFERSDLDYRRGELLRLLYSLLKIACQCYGKLRSPFGGDQALKDSGSPESAVAKLFASTKRSASEYSTSHHCLQNFPSEAQIQVTAVQVQKLLVSGRIKEALQRAQEGQLWGPALVLATQLGAQYYADTVKKMAVCQLVDGSPLRTLCLLIAGQPADVFSSTTSVGSPAGAEKISQQSSELGALSMLHDWEENLAIITANRTKDDELVIIHLGDCLWKDKGEVLAAHICYLVAEANFASYSDTARLCLIGADHWRFPRTYASPEAIQSTELYEYSKVLGNPQFLLLPFQPYKFIYALMLAEVGKLSDALKYCQAILKCLKTGRASEVDTWKHKVASLEERLRIHQQGGYSANLAPGKLVGKLLNLFDSTAHLVVGGFPPPPPAPVSVPAPTPTPAPAPIPLPSVSKPNNTQNEHDLQKSGPRVYNSQSTMAMSTLVPSSSVEPVSEWTGGKNRIKISNRCASEPDFGKSPRKADDPPKESSTDMQEKPSAPAPAPAPAPASASASASASAPAPASASGGSRFGRFSSSLFQKTVGFVLRSRSERQAKLGGENKFYYDEKLKRWVEEGAEPPTEEVALPPPPTASALQNKTPSVSLNDATKTSTNGNDGSENKSPNSSESSSSSGIPPMPPGSNQLASRRRMGVRSRYVDTFNKGNGSQTSLFQSPSSITSRPGTGLNTKFFVPSPPSSIEDSIPTSGENTPASIITSEFPSPSSENYPFFSSSTANLEPIIQRIPSMDHIANQRMRSIAQNSVSPHSRRTLSWGGGSISNPSSLSKVSDAKSLVEALGLPGSVLIPGDSSSDTVIGSGTRDDLHEVEL